MRSRGDKKEMGSKTGLMILMECLEMFRCLQLDGKVNRVTYCRKRTVIM
jgi:hypothetical protein